MIYRLDWQRHDKCSECGETGPPRWEGPNPAAWSANRGVTAFMCGTGWRCGEYACRTNQPGCNMLQVSCYRCGINTRNPGRGPSTWERAYFTSA